jgi:hypothetical protein
LEDEAAHTRRELAALRAQHEHVGSERDSIQVGAVFVWVIVIC